MYSAALIVFREVLEAALVVSIVLAASRGVPRRVWSVGAGLVAGVGGAVLIALFAESIANMMDGFGQELLNAGVLLIAVLMLAWHNIWMSSHARSMVAEFKKTGSAVLAGDKPLYALAIIVGVALLREGSEVVMFLYGISVSGTDSSGLLMGGLMGVVAGISFGALLYYGLVNIPVRYLFSVTGWMILLLAAGMAAQASGFLMQAGYLPDQTPLWDSSGWLPMNSVSGQLLHILVGYDSQPTAIQLTTYVATVAMILFGMTLVNRRMALPAAPATNQAG
ncbi:MAG: FTR1 family protein [Hahellaceae bacterium]|nr:FTR1 family protein [Hahellaceae bacterium]